jgi:hypothetical protein
MLENLTAKIGYGSQGRERKRLNHETRERGSEKPLSANVARLTQMGADRERKILSRNKAKCKSIRNLFTANVDSRAHGETYEVGWTRPSKIQDCLRYETPFVWG